MSRPRSQILFFFHQKSFCQPVVVQSLLSNDWHLLLFSIDSKVGGVCQQLQLSDHAPLSQFARFSPYQPNRAHVGPPTDAFVSGFDSCCLLCQLPLVWCLESGFTGFAVIRSKVRHRKFMLLFQTAETLRTFLCIDKLSSALINQPKQ